MEDAGLEVVYWGYSRIMENKMETTIMGKENGNYYNL